MFGNTFGRLFRITCCGESYSGGFRKDKGLPEQLYGGLMTIVDGVPPGIKITAELIQAELDKRKPGQTPLDSPRKEKDRVYIFSGVMENDLTTGAPVGMIIPNNDIQDIHIDQYRSYKDEIRPGHAEYGFFKKYGEYGDWVGAGRASGRETASRVAGGAVAKAILDSMGIDVIAYSIASHGIRAGREFTYEEAKKNYRKNEINCPDLALAEKMKADVLKIKEDGETVGGIIECIAHGVPAGLGEPVFDKINAMLAHGICSIGAIKGIEFGAGFKVADMVGSQSNDPAYVDPGTGHVRFKTNHAGGILGGITTWEEIRFRCAVKPTPTVSVPQETVNVKEMKNVVLSPITRRDPSLLPRIYPVIEAMTRCVLLDAIYMAEAYWKVSKIDEKWLKI
ncbi:MAG: Chorismate synthase [Lentisphaerae bacterium ADurb.Bin242]|nr:MAG: Chorismate synthase [Lentisphaerae bacterium ADurb.Bin242]